MNKTTSFPFKIDHIDPLGQGISKNPEIQKISFILKTLPGESGTAHCYKEKGKLRFGVLLNPSQLKTPSPDREDAPCPHYHECLGCHFLHTSYQKEIEFKETSFKFMTKNLKSLESAGLYENIQSDKRLFYRNRIQLHYDKKTKSLGFINKIFNEIHPVPQCQLPNKQISGEIKKLYTSDNWLDLVNSAPNKGHIEIYQQSPENPPQIFINQRYSAGGFTQVNDKMNNKLKDLVYSNLNNKLDNGHRIIDLFGGNGNLTSKLTQYETFIYDSGAKEQITTLPHQTYHQVNLYKKNAHQLMSNQEKIVSALIVDPPRSGLKNLDQFVQELNPKILIYVSCHPASMVRDLQALQKSSSFIVKKLILLDLFPSTYHFEAMAILEVD